MAALRHHLLRHRLLAAWLVAMTLAMKLLVPGGYMIGTSGGAITIILCSGDASQTMAVAMPGMAHHPADKDMSGKAEMPCAFSALAASSLGGADVALLAAAIAFIFVAAFRPTHPPARPAARLHLRPPLRGPPPQA